MERSNIGNYDEHIYFTYTNVSIVIDVKLPNEMQLSELDDIEFPGSTRLFSTNLNNKAQIKIPTSIISTQFNNEGMCHSICIYQQNF